MFARSSVHKLLSNTTKSISTIFPSPKTLLTSSKCSFSTISLNNLRPGPNSRTQWKKCGRGRSSGKGKTSGRGQKGYYARSGASGLIWYEGGQSQLWRKTPKYGFKNCNKKPLQVINISKVVRYCALGRIDPKKPITMRELKDSGAIRGRIINGVKLLGRDNKFVERLGMPLNIEVTHSSRWARDAVRRTGGDVKFQWYSKLGLRHLLKPGSLGHFTPKPSVPPPRLSLRYEHQLCGRDDLVKLEELRKARIVRKIKKRI